MCTCMKRLLRTAAAAAAATLFTLSPAQAVVYTGAWDPLYGLPFNGSLLGYDLGWKGTVEVDVPDACVRSSGVVWFVFPTTCGVGGGPIIAPQIVSASVELYEPSADPLKPDTPIATLAFGPLSMDIVALRFANDNLEGMIALPSQWLQATLPAEESSIVRYFSLAFVTPDVTPFLSVFFGEVPNDYSGPLLFSHPLDLDDVDITWRNVGTILADLSISNVDEYPPEFPPGGLFSLRAPEVVPEPGSLALVSLALVATGWVARSRRRR
jgi:hypothetical protein